MKNPQLKGLAFELAVTWLKLAAEVEKHGVIQASRASWSWSQPSTMQRAPANMHSQQTANLTGSRKPPPVKEAERAADLSERQKAVLSALRANVSENNLAEVRATPLAKAAHIPVGSLHSVLTSLEKKQLIRTDRPRSAKAPAIYQILDVRKG
jgi:hypothetical protein